MTEAEMVEFLTEALETGEDGDQVARVSSFAECGLLTSDDGLVVTMADGSQFQVTVVQSRPADNVDDEDEEDEL